MALALVVAVPIYVPLFRMYRTLTPAGGLNAGPQDVLQGFFLMAIGPATAVLLLAIVIFAIGDSPETRRGPATPFLPRREILVAAAFACIPLIGVVGVKLSHGPFFERYFLSSTAGYGIFLALASSRRSARRWLAASMFLLMLGDLGIALYHRARHSGYGLVEPSSKFKFSPSPEVPLDRDSALLDVKSNDDILVLEEPNYLYLFRYAPSRLVPHLYYGAPTTQDEFFIAYTRLAKWVHLDLQATTFEPFLARHNRFFAYSSADGTFVPECGSCTQTFLNAGYTLKSVRRDADNILYEYEK
jgi:hypothetical protein